MFRALVNRLGYMLVVCAAAISLTVSAALVVALIVYLLSLLVP